MELVDNKAVSRGLVRVQPGEDLLDALEKLAQVAGWREAFVTGCGSFELVELSGVGGDTVTLENAELVSMSGHMRRADGLAQLDLRVGVLGQGKLHHGRVEAAVSGAMLLMIEAITPEAPSRAALTPNALQANALQAVPPPARGGSAGFARSVSSTPTAAIMPSAMSSPVMSPPAEQQPTTRGLVPPSQSFNAKPMRKPSARSPEEDEYEAPEVDIGDVLDHPQLGLCEVEDYDPSGGVRVRVTSGRLRVLRLDALEVLASEQDDQGRRVFKIAGPRRRR